MQQANIQIDQKGDANVTLTYQDNPVEYLGIETFLATSPAIENYQRSRGTWDTADFTINRLSGWILSRTEGRDPHEPGYPYTLEYKDRFPGPPGQLQRG